MVVHIPVTIIFAIEEGSKGQIEVFPKTAVRSRVYGGRKFLSQVQMANKWGQEAEANC